MLLRFISASPARTTLTLVSTPTVTGYALLASADFGDSAWQHDFAGPRGTQGARPAPGVPQNRTVTLPIRVAGTSKDDLAVKLGDLEQIADEFRRYGGQIQWQSNNATWRVWFDVLTATWARSEWGNRAEVINRAVVVVSAVCAPYVRGDPLDFYDDFTASATSDYTFDAGGGTAAVAGGVMGFSSTAEKRFYQNLAAYPVADVEVTMGYAVGSTAALPGVFVRRTSANDYVSARIDTAGANLTIRKVIAGVEGTVTTTALTTPIVAGGIYWIRLRAEGDVLTAEHWTAFPRPQDTPAKSLVQAIGAADQAAYGRAVKGYAGVRFVPAGTLASNYAEELRVEPFTYRGIAMPQELRLLGVPGTTDAIADAWFYANPSASAAAQFGMLAWARLPAEAYNWIWNGGFEYSASGWSSAAVGGISAAATSVGNTGNALFGAAGGRVVTPGTAANEGASFHIYRRFERGRLYTFSVWVRSNTGANQNLQLVFGLSGDGLTAIGTPFVAASTGAWTQQSVTWTPIVDHSEGYVAIRTSGTTAYTFDVDGAMVYEGTTAPTARTQVGGRGGYPPIGLLYGASVFSLGGGTITADATAYGGYRLGVTPAIGAIGFGPAWRIDPGLLWQDDYQQEGVEIELWARLYLSGDHTGVGIQAFAAPLFDYASGSSSPSALGSFTREWGSTTYKLVPQLSAGVQRWVLVRLGSIPLPAGGTARMPWELQLNFTGTANVGAKILAVDHLLMVPARSRCLSPTGADKTTRYPSFFPGSPNVVPTRVVRSDLRGQVGLWTANTNGFDLAPASGLGGSPIEIPTGDVMVIPRTYGDVPDALVGTDTLTDSQNWGFHLALIPRFGLLRDA